MGVNQSQPGDGGLYLAPLSPLRLNELIISSSTSHMIRIRLPSANAELTVDGPAAMLDGMLAIDCADSITLDFGLSAPPGSLNFGWATRRDQVAEGPLVPVDVVAGRWSIAIPITSSGALHVAFLSTRRAILASFSLHVRPVDSARIPASPILHDRPVLSRASTSPQPGSSAPRPPMIITSPDPNESPPGVPEDGPVFRALIADLERRVGLLRKAVKKLLKSYEAELAARTTLHEAEHKVDEVFESLPGVRPLQDVYFSARRAGDSRRRRLDIDRLSILIEEVRKIATVLKAAEAKRKSFESESKTWYDHLAKYLAAGSSDSARMDERHATKSARWALSRVDYHDTLEDAAVLCEIDLIAIITRDAQAKAALAAVAASDPVDSLDDFAAVHLAELIASADAKRSQHVGNRLRLEAACLSPPGSPDGNHTSLPRQSLDEPAEGPIDRKHRIRSSLQLLRIGEKRSSISAIANGIVASSSTYTLNEPDFSDPTRKKEGFLYATTTPQSSHTVEPQTSGKSWHKLWVVLAAGVLTEYTGWRDGDTPMEINGTPIQLRFATVRRGPCERRFTFEVLTTSVRRTYQATSEEDAKKWARAIANAIEALLNGTSTVRAFDHSKLSKSADARSGLGISSSESTASLLDTLSNVPLARKPSNDRRREREASAPGKLVSSISHQLGFGNGDRARQQHLGVPRAHSSGGESDSSSVGEDLSGRLLEAAKHMDAGGEKNALALAELMKLPANQLCADCGRENPRWASWNLGIYICIACSGIHRSLGTHISKVRSVDLDDWSDEQIASMKAGGNDRAQQVYGGPASPSTTTDMAAFIRAKYASPRAL